MELEADRTQLALRMSSEEAAHLGVALAAGYESVSRAEYFIRTGLSEPQVRALSLALLEGLDSVGVRQLPIDAGVEEVENPRRPRP